VTFSGIDHRSHSGKEITAPVGTESVGQLAKDFTHPPVAFTLIGGWRNGSLFQKQKPVLLQSGLPFLESNPVWRGWVEIQRRLKPTPEVAPLGVKRRVSPLLTPRVNHQRSEPLTRLAAAFQRGRGEQDKKVRARLDAF